MTEPRHDDASDPELSRLYRAHADAEPSAAIDRRILAAGRLAATPPAARRRGWWQRWRMPLTLAATVMLTAALALLVERQPETPTAAIPEHDKARAESTPEGARQPAAPPARRQPPPPPSQENTPEPRLRSGEHDGSRAASVATEQAAAPSAPAAKAENAPPPASEAGNAATRGEIRSAAPALSVTAPAAPPLAKSRADSVRPPAVWLEEIRALRGAGKHEEAERQLREFRLAHPDYPLPEEFRR